MAELPESKTTTEVVLEESEQLSAQTKEILVAVASGKNSVFTTLSDGTVLEILPYDEATIADQSLHDAASLILECAQTPVKTEDASSSMAAEPSNCATPDSDDDCESEPASIIRDDLNPDKAFCTGCRKKLNYKNYRRHLWRVHKIHAEDANKNTKCIHPNCDQGFYQVKSMIRHLEEYHGVKVESKELHFPNWEAFMTWKTQEEDTNYVYFSKRNGSAVRPGKTISYFICQRDGPLRLHRRKDYVPTGRTTKKGSVRRNLTCPARIKTYSSLDGSVKAVYTYSHNHSISPQDTLHQPLSKNKIDKIRKQLQKGLNPEKIHASLTTFKAGTSNDTSHVVSKRRIDSIKKRLDRENRLSSDEASSVHLLVTRLQAEKDSAVVLYVCSGIYESEGHIYTEQLYDPAKLFLVVYQSPAQLDMMKAFASRVLIIDAEGTVDNNGNQLINILVSDEFHCAFPVAHIITNNWEMGLQLSLRQLKERVPDLNLTVVFVPNDAAFSTAVSAAFDHCPQIRYFFGRWETIRQWEKKIKLSIFSSTIRRDLSQMLGLILNEPNVNKFEILLDVFLKEFSSKADRFIRYFEKCYAYVKRTWAKCYRDFCQFGTDRPDYMKKFLNRLDWWLSERPTNKRVDDLINLLVRIDNEYSAQRKLDLMNYPAMWNIPICKHTMGERIPDERITPIKLHDDGIRIWLVASEDSQTSYVVKQIRETCEADFCWDSCLQEACNSLCCHMYSCTCEDGTGLCQHIHKLRCFSQADKPLFGNEDEATYAEEDVGEWPESMEIVVMDQAADDEARVIQVLPDDYAQLQHGNFHDGLPEVAVETIVESGQHSDSDNAETIVDIGSAAS